MSDDFYEFTFLLSHDAHGSVAAWKREGLYHKAKISRAALERLHRPRPVGSDMTEAFKAHEPTVVHVATSMIETGGLPTDEAPIVIRERDV